MSRINVEDRRKEDGWEVSMKYLRSIEGRRKKNLPKKEKKKG